MSSNTPILQQQTRNTRQLTNVASPDTDSRAIELVGQGLNVIPDLMHDHTRMQYTSPPGNTQTVNIHSPINWEDVTLHTLILDNTSNAVDKVFIFNNDHVFLDPTGGDRTYNLKAGKQLVWFGTARDGKMYWRESIESTNV